MLVRQSDMCSDSRAVASTHTDPAWRQSHRPQVVKYALERSEVGVLPGRTEQSAAFFDVSMFPGLEESGRIM